MKTKQKEIKVIRRELDKLSPIPMKKFATECFRVASEGHVLLKNDGNALPIKDGERISVFGRIQERYYGMGAGSGGGVNPPYQTDILSELRKDKKVSVNEELASEYAEFIKNNPYDEGGGWIHPFSQTEMPLNEDTVIRASEESDVALIIIGRLAGEDCDSAPEEGSYYLSDGEENMIRLVCRYFARSCVYLNVGAIFDMSWVEKYNPSSVIYGWQGGMEGGRAAAAVLRGKVNPSGRLTDTIAKNLNDYPSTKNFGNDDRDVYEEDIYVGYRYFETFAKEKVLYPFGYGLSYTTFERKFLSVISCETGFRFEFSVKNTGTVSGKDALLVYASAPCGKLGKPARILAGYAKTPTVAPGKSTKVSVTVPLYFLSSYDDSGVTGHRNCYVAEAGKYSFFVGGDIRDAKLFYDFSMTETTVISECCEACAPTEKFERIKAVKSDGEYAEAKEDVPVRTYDIADRIRAELPVEPAYTGDRGFKLSDVKSHRCTMDEFTAQIDTETLVCLCRGEGMRSMKVNTDTASIFGGVTKKLRSFGIPICTDNDGPCGLRDLMSGTNTTSMPSGTCCAATYNDSLIESMMKYEGIELHTHNIDTLLGPGMNIHRNPLGGRNFEYFSEDPVLSGKMAAAMSRGVHSVGKSATIKHMMANSQEHNRHVCNMVISQRAIREIYLKGFEIAVKEGGVDSIMTSYNPVNGIWCAGSYDLNTKILREEWRYTGMVMTDWWATVNGKEGTPGDKHNIAEMIIAQNDVYMLVNDSEKSADNINRMISDGKLTRGQIVRSAENILRFILTTDSLDKFVKYGYSDPFEAFEDEANTELVQSIEHPKVNEQYPISKVISEEPGENIYLIKIYYKAPYNSLEQRVAWFKINGEKFELTAHAINYSCTEKDKTECISVFSGMNGSAKSVSIWFVDGDSCEKIEIFGKKN